MLDEPRLLVVDDEEVICEGCRRIFSRQGFEVEKCSDACQGLSLAKQNDYSAILLDIKMPTMDGIAFLEALRKQKADVPVVLMTGLSQHSQRGLGDPAGGFRLRDQALHAGRNHAGRAPPAAPRSDAPTAKLPPPAEPAASAEPFRFWRRRLVPAGRPAGHAGRGRAHRSHDRQDRVGPPAADRRSRLSGPAAGRRDRGRQAAAVHPRALSGVVVAVNEALKQDPALLLSDPCGKGWIACISATRADDEVANCLSRRVILYNPDVATAQATGRQARRLGCDVHAWPPIGPN